MFRISISQDPIKTFLRAHHLVAPDEFQSHKTRLKHPHFAIEMLQALALKLG